MQLKKDDDGGLGSVLRFLYRCLYNKKAVILYIFVIFIVGCIFGMGVGGFFGTLDNPSPAAKEVAKNILSTVGLVPANTQLILSGLLHENYKIPINYINGLKSNPERITIDIKNNDFQKLAYKREIALAQGILIGSDDDWVPAKIQYKGQTVDVRLRLKGDWTDHLKGDKWSFRIKVRGDDTLLGMKLFSIQEPKTRNYLNEWLFQQALEREEIVSLRYDFIDVTINGKHKGIYALEEHFEKRLVEHNRYREGPILKTNEDIVWDDRLQYFPLYHPTNPTGLQSMYSSDIDVFRKNKTLADSTLFNQFITGKDLLESFRNGTLQTHQVFDVPKLAKYIAMTDLMGAQHALGWHNLRFYYNPVTSLLEPISFDGTAGQSTTTLRGSQKQLVLNSEQSTCSPDIFSIMFSDPVFFERYNQELERLSQKSYMDDLFIEVDADLKRKIHIIYKDYPYYHFSKDVFYNNQNCIRKVLNPIKGLHAYFYQNTTNGSIILEVGDIQSMPIEILNVSYKESQIFEPKQNMNILQAKISSEPVQYEKIEFMLPEGFNWSNDCIADLRLNYKLLGTSRLRNETVFLWSHLSEDFLATDFIRQKPNVGQFDFLFVDNATKRILIKHGDWELNDSLIVPADYTVVCGEGTQLDLKNNSTILSYSPLQFFGTEDNPIVISSSDSTGQGIAVLNAGEKSVFEKVVFKNLSAPSKHGWQLTGAITFYESPVEIDGCKLSNNKAGDDMLNIVRSEFEIKNSLFKHALSDALDVDFGKGSIFHTSFVDCGNDGLDFSGSAVDVTKCFVSGAGDKGVSVGENSRVNVNQIEFNDCYVATASKDRSQVNIENVKISASEVGFVIYQKKSEFGQSAMAVSSVDMINVTTSYLIEEGSTLLVDNQKIDATQKDVWGILYGEK
ncbi:MAG: CotH kinase family protein [Thermotogota bacterium]|nr:CotH kinase family protein [Thermotogota bacterium]